MDKLLDNQLTEKDLEIETKEDLEIEIEKVTLTKKDLQKAFWRWTFFSHANYNYERLQATGVIHAFSPILKKLYGGDKDGMKNALERHMQFFNTEPSFGGPILSVAIAMEEGKANGAEIEDSAINGFKTGLMGPLAGIGDTLWQGTLIPILLSFTIPFAAEGNFILGPILFFVSHMAIMLFLAYNFWMKGYDSGKEGIVKLMQSDQLNKVLSFTRVLGPIVIGALAAQFVSVSTPLEINLGTEILSFQTGVLDTLVPGLLPFGITMLTYYFLKKKLKPTTVLGILVLIGVVGGSFGLLG